MLFSLITHNSCVSSIIHQLSASPFHMFLMVESFSHLLSFLTAYDDDELGVFFNYLILIITVGYNTTIIAVHGDYLDTVQACKTRPLVIM